MKKYLPAIIVCSVFVLLAGGAIIYAVISTNKKSPETALQAAPTPVNSASDGSTLGVSSDSAIGSTLQSNLGSTSSAAPNPADAAPSAAAPKAPTPDQFGQYDKYKNDQAALFSDLVIGTGNEATASSKVEVTYQGWLTNGTLFDASKTNDKGQLEPFIFQVGAHTVIPGWEQDIVGMKVGGTRRFVVPPVAGYGADGHDPVPPNAVLVFDVVLLAAL